MTKNVERIELHWEECLQKKNRCKVNPTRQRFYFLFLKIEKVVMHIVFPIIKTEWVSWLFLLRVGRVPKEWVSFMYIKSQFSK